MLSGRLSPFINFEQILTVHHMACITSHSHFSRPGLSSLGRFVFHLAVLGPCPTQQAHAGVSEILPHEKLAPLSLNLCCVSGIHISL